MNQIDPMGSEVTSRLIGLALDAAVARHAAIASNIANVDTQDYRPLMAKFDQLVDELRGRIADRTMDANTEARIRSLQETLSNGAVTPDSTASKVELDMQMASLTKNLVQYQALLVAGSKLMAMSHLVITEGKV